MASRDRTSGRFLLVLGTIAALAIASSTMAKNPALPLLALHIGADDAQIGLISAVSPIPGILISGIAGAYSDKHGRARVITLSLLIFASAPFLYLFITNVWQLALVRFYHGFATAMFMPVATAAVADRFAPAKRGEALGTFSSFSMVGRFSAPFLGGALLYYTTFSSLYLTIGVSAAIALALSFIVPWDEGGTGVQAKKFEGTMVAALRNVLEERRIMLTSSMEAVQYFAMGAFETFLPVYMDQELGLTALEIGTVMGLQVVAMLLAKPFLGRLSDRWGRVPFIVTGLMLGAITIVLMPWTDDGVVLSMLSIGFGLTVATVTASTSALVTEIAGTSAHGSSIGVLSSIMDVGHSIGPFMTGIVVGTFSFTAGFGLAGALLTMGAIVFAVGMRGHRK
ncbi:MAG TPA: MFS transporter [Methanomassiliicoccales archaeon]|nr:MFS transporter [Euryarchaeota archaeon]HOE52874.1 MFS transporter [Methanomassiliicoccales archaeon]HOO03583.1 MFS transporter [Methanomassiliicoccales archaeon]HQM67258.1 MFS transporter [Methanomassiliicoccales archaeon]